MTISSKIKSAETPGGFRQEEFTDLFRSKPPAFGQSLSELTSFGTGGPALAVAYPCDVPELIRCLRFCEKSSIPRLILGNGSNTLFSDEGFDGVIVRLDGEFKKCSLSDDGTVIAGAACRNEKVSTLAQNNSLTGAEFLATVPGTIGGATYMNAGAHGQEISDYIIRCCALTKDLEEIVLQKDSLGLAYRTSVFQENGFTILFSEFRFSPSDRDQVRERKNSFSEKRKASQPYQAKTWGSVFKNPAGASAGALIEKCGLKGHRIGGAEISEIHANFIVNPERKATTADGLKLMRIMKEKVRQESGIELETEVIVYDRAGKKINL